MLASVPLVTDSDKKILRKYSKTSLIVANIRYLRKKKHEGRSVSMKNCTTEKCSGISSAGGC